MKDVEKYSNMLMDAVAKSGLTYGQIIQKCSSKGVKFSAPYLSKLCNGLEKPATDRINKALAEVLGISFKELTKAKYRETLEPDVYELLIAK